MMTHIQFLSQLGFHYYIGCLIVKHCTFGCVAQQRQKEYGSFAEKQGRAAAFSSIGDKTGDATASLRETLVQLSEVVHCVWLPFVCS